MEKKKILGSSIRCKWLDIDGGILQINSSSSQDNGFFRSCPRYSTTCKAEAGLLSAATRNQEINIDIKKCKYLVRERDVFPKCLSMTEFVHSDAALPCRLTIMQKVFNDANMPTGNCQVDRLDKVFKCRVHWSELLLK